MKTYTVLMDRQQLEVMRKALTLAEKLKVKDKHGDDVRLCLIDCINLVLAPSSRKYDGVHSFVW